MLRLLLLFLALAACTPSPRKDVMPSPSPISGTAKQHSNALGSPNENGAILEAQAAQGPNPEPVSAAGTSAPGRLTDSPAAALGRRTLSTAFVRIGPDGHLTVELKGGHILVLRDVVMGSRDFCGVRVPVVSGRSRYCSGYAEVVAARPGGATVL